MKATPEDVAKTHNAEGACIATPDASMKATPEDVAKLDTTARERAGLLKPQ